MTDLWIFADPLTITNLKPYTDYTVRLAALNVVGTGPFSEESSVRTQGIRTFKLLIQYFSVNIFVFSLPLKESMPIIYKYPRASKAFLLV